MVFQDLAWPGDRRRLSQIDRGKVHGYPATEGDEKGPDPDVPHSTETGDIEILVSVGGRDRGLGKRGGLFAAAAHQSMKVLPTAAVVSLEEVVTEVAL